MKPRRDTNTLTPDQLLSQYPLAIQTLANDLRKCLRSIESLSERALPGWRAIAFRDSRAGHVAALFPFADHVKLYFEFGAVLDDPDGLLEGNTKQTRFVTFRSPKDIRRQALLDLMQRAIEYQQV